MGNTQEKLKEIISEYVDVNPEEININMDLRFDVGLDSFGMMSLISAIENEFNIYIPETKCVEFNTLSDMVSFIDNRRLALV